MSNDIFNPLISCVVLIQIFIIFLLYLELADLVLSIVKLITDVSYVNQELDWIFEYFLSGWLDILRFRFEYQNENQFVRLWDSYFTLLQKHDLANDYLLHRLNYQVFIFKGLIFKILSILKICSFYPLLTFLCIFYTVQNLILDLTRLSYI